jgi:ParB family transcriptional regulator, chromosome partitioning protein
MSADTDQPSPGLSPSPEPSSSSSLPGTAAAPWLVPVGQLAGHPGNVRGDLHLSTEFCASVAASGVRIPLLVAPDGDGYRVIEGHRRLAAAVQIGLLEVPCVLDAGREGDDAGQFLDMAVANGAAYRRNFTALEEAGALFSAAEAGATRTRIRRATGRSAAEVKAALQAGGLPEHTRDRVAGLGRPVTLADLALVAEFDGDDDATTRILEALDRGLGLEHTAERIRHERAEAAARAQLAAELEAAGVTITADLPGGAVRLADLAHDGEALTPEGHAGCPGRGAYFASWNLLSPSWYCASPGDHGHAPRLAVVTPEPPGGRGGADPLPDPPAGADGPGRRLVIEGNRAWAAAAQVRRRWLQGLLARRTAPREVTVFVARQLLTMPAPLRACLGTVHATELFTELTGQSGDEAAAACDTSPAGRLPLLMLAPVITAYEREIAGSDDGRRGTWRQDRYSPCPRSQAGIYLAFLAALGYELSSIEQAVADGVPYTGDDAPEPGPAGPAGAEPDELTTSEPSASGQPDTEQPADEQPAA